MEEHRDIYQQKDREGNEGQLPAYEPTPEQVHRNARRRTVLLIALALCLVGMGAVFVTYDENSVDERSDLKERLTTPRQSTQTTARTTATMIDIPLIDTNPAATGSAQPGPAVIPPAQMAEAMDQLRTARERLMARDWTGAEAATRKSLVIWPDMTAALRMMGVIFVQRGQFDEAVSVLEKVVRQDPLSAEALNTLGTAYMQKRMADKAEDAFLRALNLRPDYAAAFVNLGLLHLLFERYDRAAEYFEKALPRLSDNATLANNLAVCYIRLGRMEDARALLTGIAAKQPERAATYFNIAVTYTLDHDYTNALSWIRRGATNCPPKDAQHYLTDEDFTELRKLPDFQLLLQSLQTLQPPVPPPATAP